MVEENQAELRRLRARVYGRSEVDPGDVDRLIELESGAAPTPPGLAVAPSAPRSPVEELRPGAAKDPATSRYPLDRAGLVIATIMIVAIGGFVAGLLAGASAPTVERATGASSETRASVMIGPIPEELTPSLLRVAAWWQWDSGSLRLGGAVDGAAIWVGSLDDASDVCLVFDETTSATILCNPAGEYPSSFEWVKSSVPSPGTYRLTLEETGHVEWTFEPAA